MSCLCFRGDAEQLLSHLCKTNRHVESLEVTRCFEVEIVNCGLWISLSSRCLNRLIKCCPKIRNLKFEEMWIRSDKFYDNLGILLPKLTCLHLSHSHLLTPQRIKNIVTKCCNLAQFCLSGLTSRGYKKEWEDAYCTLLQQHWRTLTHLQFDASKLRDEAFKVLKYLCMYVRMCVCVCVCVCELWYVMYVCTDRWMDGQMDVLCEVKNSVIAPISGLLNL